MTDDDPRGLVDDALALLVRAVDERDAPFRNLALATVGADGAPANRIVVLRAVARDPLRVTVFSDARAAKVEALAADGAVALLAWSEPDALQLRLRGHATIHRGDDVARAHWDALSPHGREAYGLDRPSGVPFAPDAPPTLLPEAERFALFAAIVVDVRHLDVLRLLPQGVQHRVTADADGGKPRRVAP